MIRVNVIALIGSLIFSVASMNIVGSEREQELFVTNRTNRLVGIGYWRNVFGDQVFRSVTIISGETKALPDTYTNPKEISLQIQLISYCGIKISDHKSLILQEEEGEKI